MAMAFAVLGLARPGLSIRGPACVAKSYPGFWSDLARLYDSG
jgi:3-phosphoshikimate 1-carboxyvinyltransferase